ncbi:MAG: methyltransferase [Candidatus Cloacimonetes bacterium]|nr:methyltransferase [Candidatus Cloacimonadota bacterium]
MLDLKKVKPVELPFGKVIYQSLTSQGISSDTVFLVETVLSQENGSSESVLELGSGNGIIALMLGYYRSGWEITGIEIAEFLVQISQENRALCGLSTAFRQADIKEYTSGKPFSLIVSNPPYLSENKGRISPVYERAIARHEILCNLAEIMLCVKRNLKNGGMAYILNLSEREAEIRVLAEKENMVLDKIYPDICNQKGKTSIFRIRK